MVNGQLSLQPCVSREDSSATVSPGNPLEAGPVDARRCRRLIIDRVINNTEEGPSPLCGEQVLE